MLTSRTALSKIPVPPATDSYQPVSHLDAMKLIEDGMNRAGLRVARNGKKKERIEVVRNGQRAICTFDIEGHGVEEGIGFMMGWRNSYDKSMALSIFGGQRVFLCSNGMVIADHILARRHTTNIWADIPDCVDIAIESFSIMRNRQVEINDRLRDVKLNDKEAICLAAEMALPRFGVEAITVSQIGSVINEWYEPSFDHGDKTAWRFQNAVTEITKRIANKNGLTAATRNLRTARFLESMFAEDLDSAAQTFVHDN